MSVEERPAGGQQGPAQDWHSWGSPVGLGIGLVCIGGFFALITLGLWALSSI